MWKLFAFLTSSEFLSPPTVQYIACMIIISERGRKKGIPFNAKWHSRILRSSTEQVGGAREPAGLSLDKVSRQHEEAQGLLNTIVHFPTRIQYSTHSSEYSGNIFWARRCAAWWRTSSQKERVSDGWMGLEGSLTSRLGKRDCGILPGVVSNPVPTRAVPRLSSIRGPWEDEEIPCRNRPESLPPLYHVLLTLRVPAMPAPFPSVKHIELIPPLSFCAEGALGWTPLPGASLLQVSAPKMTPQQLRAACSGVPSRRDSQRSAWLASLLIACLSPLELKRSRSRDLLLGIAHQSEVEKTRRR